jgi:hypothetical protein
VPFLGILPEFEKAMDGLSQIPVEGAQAGEGHVKESMLAASFHQLGNLEALIHVHYHEQVGLSRHANNLSGEG